VGFAYTGWVTNSWSDEKRLAYNLLAAWRAGGPDPPEEYLSVIVQHFYITQDRCTTHASEKDCAAWYEAAEHFAYRQHERFMQHAVEAAKEQADRGLYFDQFTHDGQTYDLAPYTIALAWQDLAQHFLRASDREPDNTDFWELLAYKGISLRNYITDDDDEDDD
jgi:hypothetical protein